MPVSRFSFVLLHLKTKIPKNISFLKRLFWQPFLPIIDTHILFILSHILSVHVWLELHYILHFEWSHLQGPHYRSYLLHTSRIYIIMCIRTDIFLVIKAAMSLGNRTNRLNSLKLFLVHVWWCLLAFNPYADLQYVLLPRFYCVQAMYSHPSIYVCMSLSLSLSKWSVKSVGGLGLDCPLTSKIYNLYISIAVTLPKMK